MKKEYLNILPFFANDEEVKWYHFWNPSSGLYGGIIAGFVFVSIILTIAFLIIWSL